MIGYVKTKGPDNKSNTAYHCAVCGVFVTHSDATVKINGSDRHSFVNPSGINCNFLTFLFCDNVSEHPDLYLQHSWFPGYGWRFLTCRNCFQHLGWKYDRVSGKAFPESFFGVLADSVEPVEGAE